MAVTVNFRVVGLYCSLPQLTLQNVSPQNTIKEIMEVIQFENPSFQFTSSPTGGAPIEIVEQMSYNFTSPPSITPPNSTTPIVPGFRVLKNQLENSPISIWQYYRSAFGFINNTACELKLFSASQPSYATTSLDYSTVPLPEGFIVEGYTLTWRLVQIEIHPDQLQKLQYKPQSNTIYNV